MGYSATNRIQEQASGWSASASEALQGGMESARDTITHNPATAVFTAFGLGLGIGVGLALAFAPRQPPPMDYGLREKFAQFMDEHMPWMRK